MGKFHGGKIPYSAFREFCDVDGQEDRLCSVIGCGEATRIDVPCF